MPYRPFLVALLVILPSGSFIACSSYGFADQRAPASPDAAVLYVEHFRGPAEFDLDITTLRRHLLDALQRQGIQTGAHNASFVLSCAIDSHRPLATDTQVIGQAVLDCTLRSRESSHPSGHSFQARGTAIASIASGELATQSFRSERRARQDAVLDGLDQIANLTALSLITSLEGDHE